MLSGLGEEHRVAPRVDLAMPVALWGENPGASFKGYSVNLSETGMLVLSEEARPPGSEVRFEISPELKGRCEIVWRRDSGEDGTFLGMRFRSLRRAARKVLAELTTLPEDQT